jgi:hypothetical protein
MSSSLSLSDLMAEVIELSGGETSTGADIASARRSIFLTLQDWAVRGLNTWRIRSMVLRLNGHSATYILPATVDDILDVRVAMAPGLTDPAEGSWPRITRASRDEYARISTQRITGRPSRWYLNRGERQPDISFSPVGLDGIGVEISYMRRPAPFDALSEDITDMPERCLVALVAEVAAQLASKRLTTKPAVQVRLDGRAQVAVDRMRENDRDRVPFRVRA